MKEYYIYAYYRDGLIYYVGKGSGRRIHDKTYRTVELPPKQNRRKLIEGIYDEDEAYEEERKIIEVIGRQSDGGPLENESTGGKGGYTYTQPESARKAIGEGRRKYYELYPEEKQRSVISYRERTTEEERAERYRKGALSVSAGHARRTPEQVAESQRKRLATRRANEAADPNYAAKRAKATRKQLETKNAKTPEQKAERIRKLKATVAAKSPEEKAEIQRKRLTTRARKRAERS